MTTSVVILVNGPAYEATCVQKDSDGNVMSTQRARGGSYIQSYVGTGQTIEITEKFVGVEAATS